jgi:hypothetical protein
MPYQNVAWTFMGSVTGLTTLTATVDWYSMRDLPVNVSPTMPVQ